MSLHHIRAIREQGGKPVMVKVVIGGKPGLDDDANMVHVSDKAPIQSLDWPPLVGVWVTVHWLAGTPQRAAQVLTQLERAGAKLFGATSPAGVMPLTINPPDSHADLLYRERELLCPA